ncbi:MAG: S8 family serine peptidase [Duganella sp.]
MKLTSISLAAALCCLAATAHADDTRRPYIVQLADQPVSSYAGGVQGLAATRPAPGKRLDLNAPPVQAYSNYLQAKQAGVLATLGVTPVYRYQLALNGFAAMLTDSEVRQLKARSDVAHIAADTRQHVLTNYTPTFLGLDQPGGLWSQLGGKSAAGEDIVIGVLDTGVWPENPSYSDRVDGNGAPTTAADGRLVYDAPPPGWQGGCDTGEGFEARSCNNKLIGARYFADSFLSDGSQLHWSEFRSARDSIGGTVGHGGHGTHTSTTAGGNHGVAATVGGVNIGATSGMAPRARLAMYKVCWTADVGTPTGENGCALGDTVAAVEQAIIDGVNVLSYSISGGTEIKGPVPQAFLHAVDAGIFVVAAAGNEGPGNGTLSHISPWMTTVAATTHDRQLLATLTLGNGARYRGASLNTRALPATALIRAQDAAASAGLATDAALCYSAGEHGGTAVLDPAKVRGKIVVCQRGGNPRLDKSLAVLQAGGAGMVLVDDGLGTIAEAHSVPTVHVSAADGALIASYARTTRAATAMSVFVNTRGDVAAPVVASFSSRGPNMVDANVLKPDLGAPGVNILAGVTPELTPAQRDAIAAGTGTATLSAWAFYDGTSMATPHVAGIGALLHQLHPTWSASAIKSALMTTATSTLPDQLAGDNRGVLPWAQGAGQVSPTRAADPGLVYDITAEEYAKYVCNQGDNAPCSTGVAPGYALNLPSITLENVAGALTVVRRVTNVGATSATYRASSKLAGYDVAVTPATLTLAPGESASFKVAFTRTSAADQVWQFGTLTWTDGQHTVNSPLQVRPGSLIGAPALIRSDRGSSLRALSVSTNFNGRLAAAVGGLKPVQKASYDIAQAPFNTVDTPEQIAAACRAGGTGVQLIPVTVPAQTMVARFELFNRDTGHGGNHDLDLALLDAGGKLVGLSRLQGSDESVLLTRPPAGSYRACVVGTWIADNRSTTFALSSAIVTPADNNGTLKVSLPGKVYYGQYATVGVNWNTAPGQRYLGAIDLNTSTGQYGATTVVAIDNDDAVPRPEAVSKQVQRVVLK